ncbi:testis-specific serine/threonine-protein kinase 1-like protein [Dinothrombium tinctorium]|uniref:Testis-specific serine/threonine-protein kinase 1-like protein n=1 Tax=Dinothrombium tinctorium TaxID=1965070 RepID=A0A3S3PK46_9ACAR|nr:testis-specific serine/threonine-protein kinase 1-like protein [Dinothrombium tinctorium]
MPLTSRFVWKKLDCCEKSNGKRTKYLNIIRGLEDFEKRNRISKLGMSDRLEAKRKREQKREENWNNIIKHCDKNIPDPEKITWEEALEGKGFILKKSELVGSSKFSDVYKAKKKDYAEDICCKIIKMKVSASLLLSIYSKRSLKILQTLNHPSILKIFKLFTTTQADKLYIFMELGENGNMTNYVKNNGAIPEKQALILAKSLADGLGYLHSLGIAHRRFGGENAFIDKYGKAKIGGLEYFQEFFDIDHNCDITPCWMQHEVNMYHCPEIVEHEPHDPCSEDTWSYGVLLFFMLTASYPFDGYKNKKKMKAQVKEKKWMTSEKAKSFSSGIKNLLEGIFIYDAVQRLAMEEIIALPVFNV